MLTDLDRGIQIDVKDVYVWSILLKHFAPFVLILVRAEKLSLGEQSEMQFLQLLAFIFSLM